MEEVGVEGGSDIVISGSSFVCFCFHDVDDMSLESFLVWNLLCVGHSNSELQVSFSFIIFVYINARLLFYFLFFFCIVLLCSDFGM